MPSHPLLWAFPSLLLGTGHPSAMLLCGRCCFLGKGSLSSCCNSLGIAKCSSCCPSPPKGRSAQAGDGTSTPMAQHPPLWKQPSPAWLREHLPSPPSPPGSLLGKRWAFTMAQGVPKAGSCRNPSCTEPQPVPEGFLPLG